MRTWFITLFLFLFGLAATPMDNPLQGVFATIPDITNAVSRDQHIKQARNAIFKACQEVKTSALSYKDDVSPMPQDLVKAFARAYAQMSFLRPDLLHDEFHEIAAKLLAHNRIKVMDLNLAEYKWQFGINPKMFEKGFESAYTLEPRSKLKIANTFFSNIPIYIKGRLPSQFAGDKLLIGGGKNCTCSLLKNDDVHPEDEWYSIDIQNDCDPDLIMNAEVLHHLYILPSRKFSMILVERLDLLGFEYEKIAEQYLRILKSNGVIIFRSANFDVKNDIPLIESGMKKQMALFETKHFMASGIMTTQTSPGRYEIRGTLIAPTFTEQVYRDNRVRNFTFNKDNYIKLCQ